MRDTRPISWLKGALRDYRTFPAVAQAVAEDALTQIAEGGTPDVAKPFDRAWRRRLGTGDQSPRRCLACGLCAPAVGRDLDHRRFSEEIEKRDRDAEA